jgi:hypothetical protein
MKTKILITLIIGAMLGSCSVSHILTNDNTERYLPTEKENIEVFSTSKIEREYEIIGDLVSRIDQLIFILKINSHEKISNTIRFYFIYGFNFGLLLRILPGNRQSVIC